MTHIIKSLIIFTIFLHLIYQHGTNAATCQIIPPLSPSGDQNEFGFVFVPGAAIKGEAYVPLAKRIQEMFPGRFGKSFKDS